MFDEQAILDQLYREVHNFVLEHYGLHLWQMRDLHTGAVIGEIHESVFHTALVDEGALDDCESDDEPLDVESLADAMLVRSLASARPSPALNRPTTQSLKRLLERQPVTVCAFLLNRYRLRDWRKLNHRDDSWFDDMLSRVRVWEQLSRFAQDADTDKSEATLRALAHWLLELDSKCNLHELTPVPGWFEAFLAIDSIDVFDTFVQEFALIATPLIVKADRDAKIGNRLASSAYVQSWFDNPTLSQRKVEIANRKRQLLVDKYGSTDIGFWIEHLKSEDRKIAREAKAKKESRIITGRSSRSKAAKLVNKHSDVLNRLFKTLGEVSPLDEIRADMENSKMKARATGLPIAVRKG